MPDTLRNPMLIHTIQDRLSSLIGSQSLVVSVWAANAQKRIGFVIKEIRDQARDNRPLVSKMIGEDLLKDIESYLKYFSIVVDVGKNHRRTV